MVPVPSEDVSKPTPDPRVEPSVGGFVQLVKDYARQETVGPIRNAGRWMAFGSIGAVLFGLATAMLVLGVLRLLQTEGRGTFGGSWTVILPYVVALAVCGAVIGIAVSRISRKSLQKEQ
jgi:hypothetical protein